MSISQLERSKKTIIIVAPICAYNDIRAGHKIASSLAEAGYNTVFVCKNTELRRYKNYEIRPVSHHVNSLFARSLLNPIRLLKQISRYKADLFILVNPDAAILALPLTILNKNFIYDTWEDYTKRYYIYDRSNIVKKILSFVVPVVERVAAKLALATFVTQFDQIPRFGPKSLFLPNAPLISSPLIYKVTAFSTDKSTKHTTLVYVGGISSARGFYLMLDLMVELNKRGNFRLKLVAWDYDKKFYDLNRHPGSKYVDLKINLPHNDALEEIRKSDIGLCLLYDVGDHKYSSPNKLYEYMEAGIPFIASDFAVWRNSILNTKAGFFVDQNSLLDITYVVEYLSQNRDLMHEMGKTGQEFVRFFFNWNVIFSPVLSKVDDFIL